MFVIVCNQYYVLYIYGKLQGHKVAIYILMSISVNLKKDNQIENFV